MPGKEMEKVTLAGEKCDFLRVKKKVPSFVLLSTSLQIN